LVFAFQVFPVPSIKTRLTPWTSFLFSKWC